MDAAYRLFTYLNAQEKGMRFRKEDALNEAFLSDARSKKHDDATVKDAAWKMLRTANVIVPSDGSTYRISPSAAQRYAAELQTMNQRIEQMRRATAAALTQRQADDRRDGSGVRRDGSGASPSPTAARSVSASPNTGRSR